MEPWQQFDDYFSSFSPHGFIGAFKFRLLNSFEKNFLWRARFPLETIGDWKIKQVWFQN